MRFYLLHLLLLLSCGAVQAQHPLFDGGARAVGLAGASTALQDDVWASGNSAGWSTVTGRGVSLFASQAFGLAALRVGAFTYAEPTAVGTFAVGVRTYGFEAYRNTRFTAGFARAFTLATSRSVHGGLALRYHHVGIEGYGRAGALSVSVGSLVDVLPGLSFGFHAANVNVPAYRRRDELERSLALGMRFAPAASVHLYVDAVKDVRFPVSYRFGLESRPADPLALRVGVSTGPAVLAAGAGLFLHPLVIDLAAQHHRDLGWSPALSAGLSW